MYIHVLHTQSTTTPGGYVVEEFSDEEIAFDNDEFDMQEVYTVYAMY